MVERGLRGARDRAHATSASRRREVREHTGWGNTQLRVHLEPAGRSWSTCSSTAAAAARASSTSCSTTARARTARRFLPGLIDVESPREYDGKNAASAGENAGLECEERGANAAPTRGDQRGVAGRAQSCRSREFRRISTFSPPETAHTGTSRIAIVVPDRRIVALRPLRQMRA